MSVSLRRRFALHVLLLAFVLPVFAAPAAAGSSCRTDRACGGSARAGAQPRATVADSSSRDRQRKRKASTRATRRTASSTRRPRRRRPTPGRAPASSNSTHSSSPSVHTRRQQTSETSTSSPTAGARSGRLFAPNSFWNARLSDNAALDPTSPARVAALNGEIEAEIRYGTGPWISESQYSTPLYTVPAGQPRVSVTLDAGSWADSLRRALSGGVPIPSGAKPAAGTDGHLTIYQPSTDTLWEFWRASRQSDGWHASWGGVMQHVSSSPGYYSSSSFDGLAPYEGWNWGSTASSLPVIGGTIMISELRDGEIKHALAIDIPDACVGRFSWPAQRTDGGSSAPECLPEGARLRLDPTLDLASLNLPRITLILARAAQRYGMVVRDVTHHAVGFYAEDPTPTGTEPYWGPDGLYGGLAPWTFLPQFPWGRLQLLKMTVCTAAPCLAPTAAVDGSSGRARRRPAGRRAS